MTHPTHHRFRRVPVELVAHRGAKRERPENTLPAFARAIELGADAIELDVHATRDGVVVVHHDPIVHGTPHAIADLASRELRELDVGGAPVPTLAEVLALAARRVTVYVEIKGAQIEEAVVEVVRASTASCAIHSFDHAAVARVRQIAPEIPRGLLFEHRGADMIAALAAHDARDLWPEVSLVTRDLVERAHHAGRRVVAWTVNEIDDAARLAAIGVDALCGDDVRLLRAAIQRGG